MPETREPARFAFGKNWAAFLQHLDADRIAEAEASLRALLRVESLGGKRLLDIGCGSGLFSLAARRLGARVHAFDYDGDSVGCAQELRARYFPGDAEWAIERGSVLDEAYMQSLGRFDVVYSWGVLHHTGAMWTAVDQALKAVAPGGTACIALYNRQPFLSGFWSAVKRGYQRLPAPLRGLYVLPFYLYVIGVGLAADLVRGRDPRLRYRGVGRRGMSMWHDAVDWVGGWPFEVAAPEEVLEFARARGFTLTGLKTVAGRHGCNEFLLVRESAVG